MIKRILGNNDNNILRFFTDRIHCLVSLSAEEDFLKPYENAGIKIKEIVIIDVRNLKRAKNIRVWFQFGVSNKKAPFILADAHFLLTSKKPILGISGINYIPLGIYFKDPDGEEIWSVGAIRKEKIKQDIENFKNLLSIFQFIYCKGEAEIMIGPSCLDTNPILEILENIGKELSIIDIYYCDGSDCFLGEEFNTIFYFKGGERWDISFPS